MQNQLSSSKKTNKEATNAAPTIIQSDEEPQKNSEPAGKDPPYVSTEGNQMGNHPSSKEDADPLEPGEIPQPDPRV